MEQLQIPVHMCSISLLLGDDSQVVQIARKHVDAACLHRCLQLFHQVLSFHATLLTCCTRYAKDVPRGQDTRPGSSDTTVNLMRAIICYTYCIATCCSPSFCCVLLAVRSDSCSGPSFGGCLLHSFARGET